MVDINATRYVRDVCDEVAALSRYLQERFRQILPQPYAVREIRTWPAQSPGSKFFEAYVCWIRIYSGNSYFGCATYLFDLGGRGTFATKINQAVVVAAWTGRNAKDDLYEVKHLLALDSEHCVCGSRLFCWKDEDGEPRYDLDDQAWCYVVPLASIATEENAERLLIEPLINLATAPQLLDKVTHAFDNAAEVLIQPGAACG